MTSRDPKGASTVGYPSDSVASCPFCFRALIIRVVYYKLLTCVKQFLLYRLVYSVYCVWLCMLTGKLIDTCYVKLLVGDRYLSILLGGGPQRTCGWASR